MDNAKTHCSCGAEHDFDGITAKKFKWSEIPEYIECSECPECNPELLDNIEDHEADAYSEDINIEDLGDNLDFEDDEILDEIN
jgi:hypothetical protein